LPSISASKDSEILAFPDSEAFKTVGEIEKEFDYRFWQKKRQILFSQDRYEDAQAAFDQSIQI
jgi:hypothetical protein